MRRVIEVTQRAWLAPYILFNTEQSAGNERDGERVFQAAQQRHLQQASRKNQNQLNVKLLTDEKQIIKYTSFAHADSFEILKPNLVQVSMKSHMVECDLLTSVGFTVLELRKLLMYEFHYGHILPRYGNKARLLFTDSDSLCYHIRTDDVYHDIGGCIELYDTNNYPLDHPLHKVKNKDVIGKMKDENRGKPIIEIVGVKIKDVFFRFGFKFGSEGQRARAIDREEAADPRRVQVHPLRSADSQARSDDKDTVRHHEQVSTQPLRQQMIPAGCRLVPRPRTLSHS